MIVNDQEAVDEEFSFGKHSTSAFVLQPVPAKLILTISSPKRLNMKQRTDRLGELQSGDEFVLGRSQVN